MSDTIKPGDPADRDINTSARVEDWVPSTRARVDVVTVLQELDRLRAELAAARAAIARVRALHAPQEYTIWSGARLQRCTHSRDETGYSLPYPCPTLRALDGEDA